MIDPQHEKAIMELYRQWPHAPKISHCMRYFVISPLQYEDSLFITVLRHGDEWAQVLKWGAIRIDDLSSIRLLEGDPVPPIMDIVTIQDDETYDQIKLIEDIAAL